MGVDSMLEGEILPRNVNRGVRTTDVVPCSEAWTVLKCHPNIAFASTFSPPHQSINRSRHFCDRFTNARGRRSETNDLRRFIDSRTRRSIDLPPSFESRPECSTFPRWTSEEEIDC